MLSLYFRFFVRVCGVYQYYLFAKGIMLGGAYNGYSVCIAGETVELNYNELQHNLVVLCTGEMALRCDVVLYLIFLFIFFSGL